jgi:hypothetical protein
MDGNWGKLGVLGLLLGVMVGCRTTQPNVKPVDGPEVLHAPPQEARFNSPSMPKEAFNRDDPAKRLRELTGDSAVMPARGSFGGPSSGMGRPGGY